MDKIKLIDEILKYKVLYRDLSLQRWIQYEVFTWVWWLGVLSTIIPFIIWWKKVDRTRMLEISVFGLIVNVSATFLDVSGSEYNLWEYLVRLLPHIPLMFPVDLILLPILDMFLYQRYPKWKGFVIANVILSAILSFVVEPLATLIGQYKLITWQYIYSFPIYIIIAIFAKFVTGIMRKRQTVSIRKMKNNPNQGSG